MKGSAVFLTVWALGVFRASGASIMPSVSQVTMTLNADSGVVTVTYAVGDDLDAITTFDVLTNGVSIGDAAINGLVGDINRKVAKGGSYSFTWRPDHSFPEHYFTNYDVKAEVRAWSVQDPPDYVVFYLDPKMVRYYTSEEALPDGGLTNAVYRNTRLVLRRIRAGFESFAMGSPTTEIGREDTSTYKETQHVVNLSQDYYIGVYELTQNQYALLTGNVAENAERDGLPQCSVSFAAMRGTEKWWPNDAHEVDADCGIDKMRKAFDGVYAFDLPTEAQWEYACRAGTTGTFYVPGVLTQRDEATNDVLAEIAWYNGNRTSTVPAKVGQRKKNALGLYDMLGNAVEYCLDQPIADLGSSEVTDPAGASGQQTVSVMVRGGSLWGLPKSVRCAARGSIDKSSASYFYGYRLCITLP